MSKILIKNGHIWSACDDFVGDILVVDDKIAAIGKNLSENYSADEVIDADGLYVFPGGIDAHTHMELGFMGTQSADDFETGTLAGFHGGTTSIIDFAIQTQGDSLAACLNTWHEKAAKAVGDYAFHCAVTDYNEKTAKEIPELIKNGITSFKTFMAYKGALMIDDRMMMGLLKTVRQHGGLVSVHAENGDIVDAMVEEYKKAGTLSPKYHALAHPPEAEAEAAGRIMDLAHYNDAPIYLVHTSCKEALAKVQQNFLREQRILVETCSQYLLLDDSCYEEPDFQGAKYVMSPPIRKKKDQKALWHALQCGHIDTIATDHCPFNLCGQKDMGKDDFSRIPNGAAGVGHRLELIFSEGVKKERITMNRFVEVMSTNPANIFGMDKKGSLAIGKDADIVLLDPNEKHTISAKTHHHNVDSSIYEGWELTGRVKTVLSRGRVVVRDNKADQIKKGSGLFQKRKAFNFSY
ncbi:MAG: dihydropyrimidinase [Halobacteriovoraceae bacterium]|jgi:dihydropyrimidinase|nr:dihydropyrimidinase [Halobacteriovoraceae bacterium]MBT5095660.1 dihydropyrimidinase [Halobacteriovoraceae bacterium]